MKTSKIATVAILLATLGSGCAVAADSTMSGRYLATAESQGVTREQVLAELLEAQRTGDIVDAHTGKKYNELNPGAYPAKAVVQGPTREQVLAELLEAQRTGDIVDAHTGKKYNELNPDRYPATL